MILFFSKLIDALESHVTIMRGTLRKKGSKSLDQSKLMKPRAASMAVEVSIIA